MTTTPDPCTCTLSARQPTDDLAHVSIAIDFCQLHANAPRMAHVLRTLRPFMHSDAPESIGAEIRAILDELDADTGEAHR